MPGKYAEEWDLPVGGLLDDVDVTIQCCSFRPDAGYNDGKSLLAVMDMTREDTSEVVQQMYSIGGDWVSADGGVTIQSTKSARARPSRNSNYGRFCEACKVIPELFEVMSDRGPTTDGRIWDGIRVHLRAFEHNYTFRGEARSTTHVLPTDYLGSNSAPIQATLPATLPLAPSAPSAPGMDPALYARLSVLAKSSGDHTQFLAIATGIPEVMADDQLVQSLMDSGPAGFYLQAKAVQ